MKVTSSIRFFAISIATMALTSLSSAASETSRFFVECHSFITAEGRIPQDYAYHLRAIGYSEEVTNGININLDDKNIELSVDSRKFQEKEYLPLYPKLTLVMRKEQPCQNSKCQQVEYEPEDFDGKLVVTYDKDKGIIFIKHAIAKRMPNGTLTGETVVQGRGGCQFVVLPAQN